MGHRLQPGVANLSVLNPGLELERGRFRISKSSREWDVTAGQPRRASVHGFALGGSSAHLVLEEAPPIAGLAAPASMQLFVFSAKSSERLNELLREMREFFLADSSGNLADIAYTLQVGREEMPSRAAVVAISHAELCAGLSDPKLRGEVSRRRRFRVAFR
jgi:acyl transferase domain-containing protein